MAGQPTSVRVDAPTGGDDRQEAIPTGKFVAPPVPTEGEAAWGVRLLALFALPFCGVGIATAVGAVRKATAGDWFAAGFLGIFALTFGGVGAGLVAALAWGRGTIARQRERAREHPDEPWLWRDDWASKEVRGSARADMWGMLAFAVLWNLISGPGAVMAVREALAKGNRIVLVALVFPVVGVGLLVAAARRALQYRRFGESVVELATVPIPVGRRLVATVRAGVPTPPADGFRVVLSCINRQTTGSGDDQSTSEHVRWQEERRVAGTAVRDYQGAGTMIPIDIPIAADAPGTDQSRPRDEIAWRLTVSAPLPGVDFEATFDVPVYYTDESRRPLPPGEAARSEAPALAATSDVPPSSITVTEEADGVTIVVPAFRNPRPTLSLAGFTLLWTGTIWVQRHFGAPLVFPIVTGAIGALLWWVVLALAFVSKRVVVRKSGLTVTTRFLGVSQTRLVDTADVADVEMPIRMQAGDTPYYSVAVRRRAIEGRRLGGSVTVADGVRDKREAERLVAAICAALGLARPSR